MKNKEYHLKVRIPGLKEFKNQYPQFTPIAKGRGAFLFKIIMKPSSFIRCKIATDLGHSAVFGIADICYEAAKQKKRFQLDDYVKRFIGATVGSLMTANHYKMIPGNKGRKSIPHPAFKKGQLYEPK